MSEWCLPNQGGTDALEVQVIDRPSWIGGDEVDAAFGSAQDITRRKEAEDLLRQRNRRAGLRMNQQRNRRSQ